MRSFLVAKAAIIATVFAALATAGVARAAGPVPITIVVFNPPSLGAVFPDVIKQQKFDIQNGIDVTFVERPPDAYAAQFNSGEFQVGGSASVLILGLGATRGIKTSYLFNLFDYWGTVVTSRPEIKTLADLKGKQLAAAKGTTNYTMFAWLAKQQGVDPDAPGGEHGDAGSGRLCGCRARRCRAALGAGLYFGQSRAAEDPHHRSQYRQGVEAISRAAARCPISASPRIRNGSTRTAISPRRSTTPISRRPIGSCQSGRGRADDRHAEERRRAGRHRPL